LAGWPVAAGAREIAVTYRPQRMYQITLVASAAAAAWCLWLILDRRRQAAMVPAGPSGAARPLHAAAARAIRPPIIVASAAAAGFGVAGVLGGIVGIGAGLVGCRGSRLPAALAALGLLATLTACLVEAPLADGASGFVSARPVTAELGRLAGVVLGAAVITRMAAERAAAPPPGEVRHLAWYQALLTGWDRRARGAAMAAVAGLTVALVVGRLDLAVAVVAGTGGVGLGAVLQSRWLLTRPAVTDAHGPAHGGHVLTGSTWVIAGFVVQALTGVAFWAVAARLHPATTIGVATALFSSLQFINFATNLGLQELLGRRHLDPGSRRDALFTWTGAVSVVTTLGATAVYLVIAPPEATRALSASGSVVGGTLLAILAAGTALVAPVDARLMAGRQWKTVFWRLVVIGAARLPLLLAPGAGSSSLGVFVVMAAPIAASGYLGVWLVFRMSNTRPSLQPRPEGSDLRFAGSAWLTNLLVLAPQFALPVVVLANVDARTNAAFFLAWTIVAVVTILPVVASRVLLIEGSREGSAIDHATGVALMIGVGAAVLATLGAVAMRPVVIALFTGGYDEVADLLPALCAGAVPWAVTAVLLGRARVREDVVATILTTGVLAAVVVGGALVLTPTRGMTGAVHAWIAGTTLSAAVSVLMERRARRRAPGSGSAAGTAM
jgi:O-antigen/teichoic acid export membrane protein